MLLTSKQAAKKLGCSGPNISAMVKRGLLHQAGTGRHLEIEESEVRELAKTYRNVKANTPRPSSAIPPRGILTRIETIEARLTALEEIWK